MSKFPKKFLNRIRKIDANAACWLEANPDKNTYKPDYEPCIDRHLHWSNIPKGHDYWSKIKGRYTALYHDNPIYPKGKY